MEFPGIIITIKKFRLRDTRNESEQGKEFTITKSKATLHPELVRCAERIKA